MPNKAIEQEARSLGWVPKEEFRGDEARWVDADTFVERGKTVLPILKKHNQELSGQVAHLAEEARKMQQLFDQSQITIKELQAFHAENTKKQVEAERTRILSELKQAKADGDTDLEVDLIGQLSEADAAVKGGKAAPPAKDDEPPPPPVLEPSFKAWMQSNPWFGKDARKTTLAHGIANLLRADPENDNLINADFWAKVDQEIAARERGDRQDKVGGSRPSGGGSGGTRKKGYADLDAEAKRICDGDAHKFVGEGKLYKTKDEWRQYYAETVLGE